MPPPARSAEALGGRVLSDTDYLSSLKLGRKTKKWRQIMVGGGGGGSGMEQNVSVYPHFTFDFELMVVVRFWLDTRSGLCDNWSVGL